MAEPSFKEKVGLFQEDKQIEHHIRRNSMSKDTEVWRCTEELDHSIKPDRRWDRKWLTREDCLELYHEKIVLLEPKNLNISSFLQSLKKFSD